MTKLLTYSQCRSSFILNCERIRYDNRLTQEQMADILGLKTATYRRLINGEIDKLNLYPVYRLSKYSGFSMLDLIGDLDSALQYQAKYQQLSKPQKRFIQAIIDFQLSSPSVDEEEETVEIPLLKLNGEFYDGYTFDTAAYFKYALSKSIYKRYETEFVCALELPTSFYTPTFVKGDILLIGRGRHPRTGEIAIFSHNRNVHLRKLEIKDKAILTSIRQNIPPIEVDLKTFQREWFCFGYIIRRMAS